MTEDLNEHERFIARVLTVMAVAPTLIGLGRRTVMTAPGKNDGLMFIGIGAVIFAAAGDVAVSSRGLELRCGGAAPKNAGP